MTGVEGLCQIVVHHDAGRPWVYSHGQGIVSESLWPLRRLCRIDVHVRVSTVKRWGKSRERTLYIFVCECRWNLAIEAYLAIPVARDSGSQTCG